MARIGSTIPATPELSCFAPPRSNRTAVRFGNEVGEGRIEATLRGASVVWGMSHYRQSMRTRSPSEPIGARHAAPSPSKKSNVFGCFQDLGWSHRWFTDALVKRQIVFNVAQISQPKPLQPVKNGALNS